MPDELLDVIDEADTVIDRKLRSVVHRLGLLHRGVHVFLFTPDESLVVQRRSRYKEDSPQALDCSVSEHLKAGESYRQAAGRGPAEELGLHMSRLRPLVKFKLQYGPNDMQISQLYEGRVDPARVRIDPLEVEQIACWHLDELETQLGARPAIFCSWFVQLLAWYRGKPSEMCVIKTYAHNRLPAPVGRGRR